MSGTDAARMGRKEAILILEYEGQGAVETQNLLTEAKLIETRLQGKGRVVTLHQTEQAFREWMTKAESRDLTKIHVVAHGNQETCGNYNPDNLAAFIGGCVAGKKSLRFITLHSCCAGEPHPDTNEIFVRQFASALMRHLGDGNSDFITVRGSDGESYTDSTGRNWVLNPGIKRIRYSDRKEEKKWLHQNTKSRSSARPKFGIYNYTGYQDVQPL